jgi:hypothetical protein
MPQRKPPLLSQRGYAMKTKTEGFASTSQAVSRMAGPKAAAIEDQRPAAAAQRKLADLVAQSPRMAAQRKAIEGMFGGAVQRKAPEEEMLQDRFDAVQKKGPEEEELVQGMFGAVQQKGPKDEEPLQGKFGPAGAVAQREEGPARSPNRTGLPDHLKAGVENLSGMAMDDVRVHYGSDKPAQLNALAYTQGTDIHVAPGQEKHLAHEAWHVVQQKQGRVRPTLQMKEGVPVNDDAGLEKEADVMGNKVLQKIGGNGLRNLIGVSVNERVAQRVASQDVADADANERNYITPIAHPGLEHDLQDVINDIDLKIHNYKINHGGNEPVGRLDQAAAGLKTFTESVIERADGDWNEIGEANRLAIKGHTPIMARNTANDADVEYRKGNDRVGIELKAVNSANVGQVTQVMNTADAQLGNRINITRHKMVIWVAHPDNQWPGILGYQGRTTDNQLEADIQNQLNGMNFQFAQNIRIIDVRTPMGDKTVKASGGNGNWVADVQ